VYILAEISEFVSFLPPCRDMFIRRQKTAIGAASVYSAYRK